MRNLLNKIYDFTIGKLVKEYKFRKRLKELRKRDPFIYK